MYYLAMMKPNKHSDKSIIDQVQIAYAIQLELQYVREENKQLHQELGQVKKKKKRLSLQPQLSPRKC